MKGKLLLACMACAGFSPLQARDLPTAGQDYYSLNIASSRDERALKKLYLRYTELPFVRVERRGSLYVLRAGFWANQRAARLAASGVRADGSFVRVAAFRPEAIVRQNWRQEDTQVAAPVAVLAVGAEPAAAQARPPSAPAPTAYIPATPVALAQSPSVRKGPDALPQFDVLRPFNPDDFALAYDVLLGGGDLARAFQVARQAVQQVPHDRVWRRKLAQVAEWTQHPEVAAQQWGTLFQQGDRAPDTVSNVIRLAFLLEDPSVALQAWGIRAQQTTLTPAQWEEVFQLYESTAEPAKGSLFFEAQFRLKKLPLLLEYAARMAENAGDDARAGALYLQRAELEPFSMDVLLRAVVNLIRRDQMQEALALMQTHEGQVPQDAVEFWRLLSQVAWELRAYGRAQEAYQQLVKTPQATSADWSRLVFLVRSQHPAQAAGLALDAYRRFGSLDQLVLGLEIYAQLNDAQAQARIFASLDADALAKAEQVNRFLLIRAQFHQHQKMPNLAWTDLRRAQRNGPTEADVALASLWFLIDEGRTDDLSVALRQYAAQAANDPVYWLAYAAANQALDRHRDAVIWYAKEIRRNPENPLVLLNYADALERSQREGMADRVRRHAWLSLKQKYPQVPDVRSIGKNPELLALVRLAMSNQPGDPGLQLVGQLARQMRGVPADPAEAGQTNALVLGWALAQEQYANARAWMWLRYARQSQTAPPLWSDAQVALQLDETPTMDRLLTHNSQGLSIYDRYDTAQALGHAQQALDIAFKGMAAREDDAPLNDRFRQNALLHANYIQLRATSDSLGSFEQQGQQFGAVDRTGVQWEARWVPDPKLQLTLGWSRMAQSSDGATLSALPDADRLDSLAARWLGSRGESSLVLFRRNEWQPYTGLHLNQTVRWGGRINLEAGLDYRADSALSQALQVYGYEHSLHASVNYAAGKREYLRISPRLTQYYTQFDDYLGAGHILDLEAGYRIRTEYPDWRVRVFSTHQHFFYGESPALSTLQRLDANLQTNIANGTVDPVALFVPASGSTFGVCAGMGESLAGQDLQTAYSRAWRPFLNICVNRNTADSEGYTGLVGLAGSLTGTGHLSVQWQNSGGYVAGSAVTRSLAIRYRHYF